jgi:hypothetical protein
VLEQSSAQTPARGACFSIFPVPDRSTGKPPMIDGTGMIQPKDEQAFDYLKGKIPVANIGVSDIQAAQLAQEFYQEYSAAMR